MGDFDRIRYLYRHRHRENHSFKLWFWQLKRCFPWPDYALADLLAVDLQSVVRWKAGRQRPRKSLVRTIGILIMVRIGAVTSGRDLLRVGKLMATGELESMVDAFLEREAALDAQADARKARKCAKTGRQTLSWTQKS